MPTLKQSLYLSQALQNAEKKRNKTGGDPQYTAFINKSVAVNEFLLKQNRPQNLTDNELLVICALYNGHMQHDDPGVNAQGLIWQVSDGAQYEPGQFKQFDVNPSALIEKVRNFTPSQCLAVIDITDQFWAQKWSDCENYSAVFDRILARKKALKLPLDK